MRSTVSAARGVLAAVAISAAASARSSGPRSSSTARPARASRETARGKRRRGPFGPVGEDQQDRPARDGVEVRQRVDRRLVGEVGVVEDQRDGAALAGGREEPAEGPDHAMAGEAVGGLDRLAGGEAVEGAARPLAAGGKQVGVGDRQLLDDRRERRVGDVVHRRRRAQHPPPLPLAEAGQLPAQRRLADPARPPDHQGADLGGARPQHRGHPRDLQLAPDEGGLGAGEAGDRLLVERRRLRARRDPELAPQLRAQAPVPADRSWQAAALELPAHQLAVGRLVGRLELDQPLELAAAPQRVGEPRAQALAGLLRPALVRRIGQQLARVQLGIALALEPLDIGFHLALGEEHDAAAAQDHRLRVAERAARVVGGLAQVGGRGGGLEVGPECLDGLLAGEAAALGEGEELDELGGAPRRPGVGCDRARADLDAKAIQEVDPDGGVWRRVRAHRSRERSGNACSRWSHETRTKEER